MSESSTYIETMDDAFALLLTTLILRFGIPPSATETDNDDDHLGLFLFIGFIGVLALSKS